MSSIGQFIVSVRSGFGWNEPNLAQSECAESRPLGKWGDSPIAKKQLKYAIAAIAVMAFLAAAATLIVLGQKGVLGHGASHFINNTLPHGANKFFHQTLPAVWNHKVVPFLTHKMSGMPVWSIFATAIGGAAVVGTAIGAILYIRNNRSKQHHFGLTFDTSDLEETDPEATV